MYLHSKFHENWVTRLLLPVVTRRLEDAGSHCTGEGQKNRTLLSLVNYEPLCFFSKDLILSTDNCSYIAK